MFVKVFCFLFICNVANSSLRPNFDNNVCKHYSDYLTIWINPNCWFNPDVKSLTDTMILRHGYPLEVYEVVTPDRYILKMYRIPHNNKNIGARRQPVFIQHGLLMDSAVWVDIGNRSLAFVLADMGYDVWLGNFRGTRPSLGHKNMTSMQKKFWNFSFDEMGMYDLPTMIDFVVEKTNMAGKIIYIGHSMGTTSFFIYSSVMPEVARRNIVGMIALAPVCYVTHLYEQLPLMRRVVPFIYLFESILYRLGFKVEGDSTGVLQNTLLEWVCELFPVQYRVCSLAVFLAVGFDVRQLLPQDLPLLFNHATVAGSTKSSLHYAQYIYSGRFEGYNYGRRKNVKIYGTPKPPPYDVRQIKVPIYLLYGDHDVLATPDDVKRLYGELQTKKFISHIAVDNSVKFNHIDFMFSKNVKELLYPLLTTIIEKDLKADVSKL